MSKGDLLQLTGALFIITAAMLLHPIAGLVVTGGFLFAAARAAA